MCAKVLIVDDDPVNIDLIAHLLNAFGHNPISAIGGQSAIEEAHAHVPDLILCDIQMPGMDGFEVLRRLRTDGRLVSTPIVGLSARAMVGDRDEILRAGFDGYVSKPITPETFVTEIEQYLPPELASRRHPIPAADVPATAVTPTPRTREGYALVVDDNPANVDLLRHLISSLGLEVRSATNTGDAIALARAEVPLLIVSDIHMSGRDGLELLRVAKSDATLKDVSFLLISSSAPSLEEQRRAMSLGVNGVILRPVTAEMMLAHLARWIVTEPHV